MNAPFFHAVETIRLADLADRSEVAAIESYVAQHPRGTVFHRPAWLHAVEKGTGQRGIGLLAEIDGVIAGWLPLTEMHSNFFGRALVSSGFAVEGGALAERQGTELQLCAAAQELAQRLACATLDVRGGHFPWHWTMVNEAHCGFSAPLAGDDEAQLTAIPRKQRAEVRKGLKQDFTVHIGRAEEDLAAHYAVYSESVRNLGTPVFPRTLFVAMIEAFGAEADILTVCKSGVPVASVLSFYHKGAVLPYWGGGTTAARALRANDRMYFELMRHARERGCTTFDFGRSKTGSGAFAFKKNWGFEPRPLTYGIWTAPGAEQRDTDPTSSRHAARIAAWRRLPLGLANRLGPHIARGLG